MANAAKAPSAKKGGGKLTRNETVTIRLDNRLNFLTDMMSRAQRRTKSSFVEWAIENALGVVTIPGTAKGYHGADKSMSELADLLYDVDEADRLANIAFHAPILLTHEERVIWKLITEIGYLWRGSYQHSSELWEEWTYTVHENYLCWERLREQFDLIKNIAMGDATKDQLPAFIQRRRKSDGSDLDDTTPFDTTFDHDNPPF